MGCGTCLFEALATDAADVGLGTGVEALVADEVGGVAELPAADITHLGLDAQVEVEVHLEVIRAVEGLGAERTGEGPLLVVDGADVILQHEALAEGQGAAGAREGPGRPVGSQTVGAQCRGRLAGMAAHGAVPGIRAAVGLQVAVVLAAGPEARLTGGA